MASYFFHKLYFFFLQTVIPRNLPTLKSNGSTSGKVVELFVSSQYDIVNAKKSLVSLQITKDDLQWVQVLSEGWASPLSGFMKEDQYLQCLHFNCLKTNNTVVNQSIAIVLPIDNNQKAAIQGTYLIKEHVFWKMRILKVFIIRNQIDSVFFMFYYGYSALKNIISSIQR